MFLGIENAGHRMVIQPHTNWQKISNNVQLSQSN